MGNILRETVEDEKGKKLGETGTSITKAVAEKIAKVAAGSREGAPADHRYN